MLYKQRCCGCVTQLLLSEKAYLKQHLAFLHLIFESTAQSQNPKTVQGFNEELIYEGSSGVRDEPFLCK